MTDQRQVDLIIQAQLKGGRDLKAITASIAELEKALERQAEAAKRGEGSVKDLEAASAALKAVQGELGGRQTAIKNFEGLSKAIERQSKAVDEAQSRLKKYEASLDSDATAKQQERVQKLTAAYERSAAKLATLRSDFANLNAALGRSGVNVSNIAQELNDIGAASLRGATAIRQASDQTRDFYETTRLAREEQRKLAEQTKKAAQDAERLTRFRQGQEDDARLALQQRAAAARRAEQAESDRLVALQRLGAIQQSRQAQVVADSELANIREAEAFLKRFNDEKERAAKRDAGLAQAAADAEKAAKGYTGLARAARDLTPRAESLRDALAAINNPAEVARTTLAGVEKEIADLANSIAQNNGRVDDYRQTLAQLGAAQRALSTQGNLIDTFNRQLVLLRNSRTELTAARDQVNQYAVAVRQGGDAGEQFVRPLAEAEARLKRAAAAVRDQTLATREARQALRDAGINTTNLSEAQQRLVTSAQRATQAVAGLARETKKLNEDTPAGRTGFSLFNDEGRTTLSLAQRIRGEILAMSAAFVGLYGVIDLARTSLQAYNQQQNLASTLGFAFGGNAELVGKQLQYLREQADRIGISYEAASKNFAKFSAAAIKSGAGVQETNFIFEAFAETGRVIGLTPDELNGLFNAIGQSFSKGKIQAEELRQQIGERLPGAFAFAQEALAKRFPDLNKALEEGKVGAENLVLIAESVRQAAAEQLPTAIQSLDAEQQRFNNSVLFFKKEIADAGFADAFKSLLVDLRALLESPQGVELAQSIGEGFAAITNFIRQAITAVVELKDEIALVVKVGLTLAGLSLFQNIVTGAIATAVALKGVVTGLRAATGAALIFQNAFVVLRVLAIALTIGAILWEQRDQIAQFAAWFQMKFRQAFITVDEYVTAFVLRMVSNFRAGVNELIKLLNRLPMVNIDLLDASPERLQGQLKALSKWADNERKKAQQAFDLQVPPVAPARAPGSTRVQNKTSLPNVRASSLTDGEDKKAAAAVKRRENEIDALNKQLDSLDARLDRAQTDNLAKQLEAIDTQYRALAKRIAEVGGKEAVQLGERWGTLYMEARNAAIEKFNEARLKVEESLQSKVEALEAAAGKKQRDDIEARREAIRKSNLALLRDLDAERNVLVANNRDTAALDNLKARVAEAQKLAIAASDQKTFAEQLAAREKEINDLLEVRKEKIAQIRQAEQGGEITDVAANDQIRQVIAQSQPALEELIASAREFGETLRGTVGDPALDAFIAKLEAARNSGARLTNELNNTDRVIRDGFLKSLDAGIGAALDGMVALTNRTNTLGGAFRAMGRAVLQVMNDVIRQLAAAAIRAAILRAISGGGNPLTSSVGSGIPSGVQLHTGGVVGVSGGRRRLVDPTWFANAPRYHAGGIVGLRPDEYPAILQKNEEVLSKSDPRNVMNGGMRQAGSGDAGSVRVVLVDDPKRAAEQLAGADGERVVMQHIRANLPTLRQQLR